MSYSFTVKAENNKLTVTAHTTDVPDGVYVVSGHEDETGRSLGASSFELPENDAYAWGKQLANASVYSQKG